MVAAEKILEADSDSIRLNMPPGPTKGGIVDVIVRSGMFQDQPRVSNPLQYEYIAGQLEVAPVKFEQMNIEVKQKPARIVYCHGYAFVLTGYRGQMWQYKFSDDY